MKIFLVVLSVFFATAHAIDLTNEHIHKIPDKKKAIYFTRGIFHNGDGKVEAKLKAIRHSFTEKQGFERLVIDFEGKQVPKIYGGLVPGKKTLSLDLFNVSLAKDVGSFGKSNLVEGVNFFPIQGETTTMEIGFKDDVKIELFSLASPARLVIDVMKK